MTYKGSMVRADLLAHIQALGAYTVNVYPDCSPHAHGAAHREAVGKYDLVISTKIYHPAHWKASYGYENRCLFVPQGYDPILHLVSELPNKFSFDVVMVATYRSEYGRLATDLAKTLDDPTLRVAIGGYGWNAARAGLPKNWTIVGPVTGRSYVSLLRAGKVCIAPLTREMTVEGARQPGDVDTTRTYELAAAHCFFIHRHSDYVRTLFSESEVPTYRDGTELGHLLRQYLARDDDRMSMAAAAHRRAVPAYSLDARAAEIVECLRAELSRHA
jgi:hypothetical protein